MDNYFINAMHFLLDDVEDKEASIKSVFMASQCLVLRLESLGGNDTKTALNILQKIDLPFKAAIISSEYDIEQWDKRCDLHRNYHVYRSSGN